MCCAAGLTVAIRPTEVAFSQRASINLETMIPKQFGDWKLDESSIPLIVNPQQQKALQKIYDQSLLRTYVNNNEQRVMLAVAYGSDQRDSLQVHRPEVCYAAQGFQIWEEESAKIDIAGREILAQRLVASQGARTEPITYWITVGNRVVRGELDKKMVKVRYGITGRIPDGMLVRISSINANVQQAYRDQQKFVRDMIGGIDMESHGRLLGLEQ